MISDMIQYCKLPSVMSSMPCALIASLMCKQVSSSTVVENEEEDEVCPSLPSKATSCGSEEEELPEYIHARRPTSRTEMKHQLVGEGGSMCSIWNEWTVRSR